MRLVFSSNNLLKEQYDAFKMLEDIQKPVDIYNFCKDSDFAKKNSDNFNFLNKNMIKKSWTGSLCRVQGTL